MEGSEEDINLLCEYKDEVSADDEILDRLSDSKDRSNHVNQPVITIKSLPSNVRKENENITKERNRQLQHQEMCSKMLTKETSVERYRRLKCPEPFKIRKRKLQLQPKTKKRQKPILYPEYNFNEINSRLNLTRFKLAYDLCWKQYPPIEESLSNNNVDNTASSNQTIFKLNFENGELELKPHPPPNDYNIYYRKIQDSQLENCNIINKQEEDDDEVVAFIVMSDDSSSEDTVDVDTEQEANVYLNSNIIKEEPLDILDIMDENDYMTEPVITRRLSGCNPTPVIKEEPADII